DISELSGLAKTNPAMAFVMTAFMFSLAGIPPLAGFWAKWFVFLAAVQAELYWLAVIGVLASVVSAFYYLRLIKIMWFDEGEEPFLGMPIELKAVVSVAGLFTILYVVVAGPVATVSAEAARTFF
ncbi:MAG: proton-conducting transporter membrane subunit, partial [Pseudomonadota bacterium]